MEHDIRRWHRAGYTNVQILAALASIRGVNISNTTLNRRLKDLNLRRIAAVHAPAVVTRAIECELSGSGRLLGYRSMRRRLMNVHGIRLPTRSVMHILQELDASGVDERRTGRLIRRNYVNHGPNYLIHIDGYDKIKKYGICIHGGICGYARKLLWLKAAHTNNDPKYVATYFMEYVQEIKGVPRCIRMDRGTENILIEDIQVTFRQNHTDDMAGERSVLYGSSTYNQRIERWWRSCKELGMAFWMEYLANLEDRGHFESGNYEHVTCIRYCFLDLIQGELDNIRAEWNAHRIRRSRNDNTPAGVPAILYSVPALEGSVDYKTAVPEADIEAVRQSVCLEPLQRGCDRAELQYINALVENRYGHVLVPCTVDEASDMYIWLIGEFGRGL